ncbi:MAG: hypothetical protein J6S45_03610, partial [Firmicutes bacterium]|nr:hypothetical protein [Bacillota bacterium]
MQFFKKKLSMALLLVFGVLILFMGASSAAEASGRTVSINSAQIAGTNVVCQITASAVPASDDGLYYVFANEVWQNGPTGNAVAAVPASAATTAVF